MPIVVADHHLKDFDAWFQLFTANPPPAIGRWRLMRGTEDRNRVCVVGEMDTDEVANIKGFFESEKMKKIFAQVDKMSTMPMEVIWAEDVTPK